MRKFLICRCSDDKIVGCLTVEGKDLYKIEIDESFMLGRDRRGIPGEFIVAYDMVDRLVLSSDEVKSYLNHRVMSPNRDCIEYLLNDMGIDKYDPIEILYKGFKGRNAQDVCYWKEVF